MSKYRTYTSLSGSVSSIFTLSGKVSSLSGSHLNTITIETVKKVWENSNKKIIFKENLKTSISIIL